METKPLETKPAFNREMLVLARESRMLTQSELATAAATTQGRVSKVESGLLAPTDDFLTAVARVLRVPVSFFYRQSVVRGLPESYHRKRMSMGVTVLKQIHADVNIRIFQLERLLSAADFDAKFSVPALDLEDYGGSPEAVARAVRSFWQMPSGPVRNLARALENAGAVLVPMRFSTREIDGISLRPVGLPPLIFYNDSAPGDRTRFTLAHELGHLVMHFHQPPYPAMEEEANAFAAEFLMPERDIAPYFLQPKVSRHSLAALKPLWKVAVGALLRRAYQLKAIDYNRYTRLWQEMSRLGYRTREPAELDFPVEEPTVISDLLKLHLQHFGYTLEELAAALDALPEELEESLLRDQPILRLVKDRPTKLRVLA
jgi:Zn-dependent peptidase ImmA (M78 family)/transcriptional regulator with XRE-family HTH domain